MNGEVCCILGICCPPENREQALVAEMVKDGVFPNAFAAKPVAEYIFRHFDLVPAGTGVPLMKAAAAHGKKDK